MLLSAAILMSDIIVCVMDFEKDTGMKKKITWLRLLSNGLMQTVLLAVFFIIKVHFVWTNPVSEILYI